MQLLSTTTMTPTTAQDATAQAAPAPNMRAPARPAPAAGGNGAASRRVLRFESFDDVIADVRQLELGWDKRGNWSLAQICDHLAKFMRFSLDGFPPGFRTPRPLAWVLRRLILTPRNLQKPMPAGMRTTRYLLPADPDPSADPRELERAAVGRLVEQCRRVKLHGGEFFPSPLFGYLKPATWRQVHLNHCAHHLGFLLPTGLEGPGERL